MHSDDLRTAILLQLESGREYGAWDMLLIAEKAAGELLAAKDTKIAELTRERDLAITHDRQPYPTAWAYEQACKALHERDRRITAALALIAPTEVHAYEGPLIDQLRDALAPPTPNDLQGFPRLGATGQQEEQ